MSFIDEWQIKLDASYAEFARLATVAQEIDFTYGIVATAVIWPVRDRLENDDGYDALSGICGPRTSQIFKAMRNWDDDPQVAAQNLALQVKDNDKLKAALTALIDHFDATPAFVKHLVKAIPGAHPSITGSINISDISGGEISVGNIISGIVSGDVVSGDKIVQYVTNIQAQPTTLPIPFTYPSLPSQFVQRLAEFERLIEHLRPEKKDRRVGIQGGGGFGKTTLASAVCHHLRAQSLFPDGILWITLGQQPNLLNLVIAQIKLLSSDPSTFSDVDVASAHLRELLKNRQVLLVLDDVWHQSHARPFIQPAPNCAHLLTSRRQDVLAHVQVETVDVNEMTTAEATNLLIKWLPDPPADQHALNEFAQYLGEWPLLLELAAAQLSESVQIDQLLLDEAIAGLRKRLDRKGFTYFDRTDERKRNQAISISLGVSLERLGKWHNRYLELAVFPEDTDIPFATIERLWAQTANLDDIDAEDALKAMQRLSLFTHYDPENNTLRIHDVVRSYLADQQQDQLPTLHAQLLKAHYPTQSSPLLPSPLSDPLSQQYDISSSKFKTLTWADLSPNEPYLWDHLVYHLIGAGVNDRLIATLKDLRYLAVKVYLRGSHQAETDLLAALEITPNDVILTLLHRTLSQASHMLHWCQSPAEIANTLHSRLIQQPELIELCLAAEHALPKPLLTAAHLLPDLPHPALIRTLNYKASVNRCAISDDGNLIVLATADNTLRVWDDQQGVERFVLDNESIQVGGFSLSGDGERLVVKANDNSIRVLETLSGAEVIRINEPEDIWRYAISADGSVIVASMSKYREVGNLKLWDVSTGTERLIIPNVYAEGFALNADGSTIVSFGTNLLKVWDGHNGTLRFTLEGHTRRVAGCAISANGRVIVSASDNAEWLGRLHFDHGSTLRVWDGITGAERFSIKGHYGASSSCAVSADGSVIISAADDGTVKLWGAENGLEMLTLRGHDFYVNDFATDILGRMVVSASRDKTLKIWDAQNKQIASLHDQVKGWPLEKLLSANLLSADGATIAATSWIKGEQIKIWNVFDGTERIGLSGHPGSITNYAVSADQSIIVTTSDDRTLKVWDGHTGSERLTLVGHTGAVRDCAISRDNTTIVSASQDYTLKVWDALTGQERMTLSGHKRDVINCVFSADSSFIVSASEDNSVKIWDTQTGEERYSLTGHTRWITRCGLSPDETLIVSASKDKTLKVWQVSSGSNILTLVGHTDFVNSCAFSPDGILIISASSDSTLKVWNSQTGICLATLRVDGPLNDCAWIDSGKQIVALGDRGIYLLRFIR